MNAVDLHVHSTFSTYDGFGSPAKVVERAVELGWPAVALTEHGHMMSAPQLYQAAKKAGIKPIIGCELYVTPDDYLIDGDKTVLEQRRHLTVLALSFEGYQNLVTWVNASMERPYYYNGPRISLDQMAELAPHELHHNVILSGCLGGELCQCLLHGNGTGELAASMYIEAAKSIFPNFYIELQNHALNKFLDRGLGNYDTMVAQQAATREQLLALARQLNVPVIVTNDSHYQSQEQRNAHLAMMARKQARRAQDVHEGDSELSQASGFHAQYAYWTHYMHSMEKVAATLPAWAEKQALQSIHDIVEEADVVLDPLDKFSYTLPRSGYDNPVDEVRRRCKSRLKSMVARHGQLAADRFEYELGAMESFADYLLIYSDIVRMARSQGIYTWTRGSAANSLVNYCLHIHEIDPIHYKLMFERFVNPARAKFPDVDIDIEGHRQPDVARMVIEHMAEIEGPNNVRGICTYSSVSNRNAFRLMAEAAGVEKDRIDELAKLLPQMIDSGMVQSDEEAYELLKEELGVDIYADAAAVFDAIGGVSQHACAFALGTEERPLATWVPNYRIGSSNAVVTQYNMKSIEEMGFLKLDLLKLDTLSIMHSIARMIGEDISWLDTVAQRVPGIYELDEETLAMLRAGKTEGIHSMQGATQRRGCIEVAVESVEDLVAVQALYRPSGTRTGNDKQYVNRKHGREEWSSTNEFVGKFLDESYGFAIYQEQIMEMGAAMGMSGEEIDDLYKAIKTAKGIGRGAKELFEGFEPTFRKYAKKLFTKDEADDIWLQWEHLQGYCVVGDTLVEKGDGSHVTVQELHDIWHGPPSSLRKKYRGKHPKKGLWLTAWRNDGIFLDKCINVIENGVKPVYRVVLADGKSITATANHPLLTSDGWKVVGQIDPGEQVVIDTGEAAVGRGRGNDCWQPGAGRGWINDTPERQVARDGRRRPRLHGHSAALVEVTKTLPDQCEECGATDTRLERAHLNHDRTDNSRGNVVRLCVHCHRMHDHATGQRLGRWKRGRVAGLSEVVSVELIGERMTYDLVMEGDEHNFVANGIVAHNTFNRGHASSYAILAAKTAWLKCHYPQEFFVSLLDRYPDNPRYVAAAMANGFSFEPPDVNLSSAGFSKGSTDKSIRVGLLRVKGIGPGAANAIVRNQPFASVEDLTERTDSRSVDKTVREALSIIGGFDSLGIKGQQDDEEDFRLLNFVLRKPKTFAGIKVKLPARRGSWTFTGLERGLDISEGKSFCAKLFWIPPSASFTTKASAMGKYNAHLLTAIDENGIPMDFIVGEGKEAESKLIKYLAKKMRGSVICAEGRIVMPFLRGGNTGFQLWGVAGAREENPLVWHASETDAKAMTALAREKESQRRN